MANTIPTRVEAEIEGRTLIISVYANLLQMTVELSAADGRQLAAGILEAVEELEAIGHVEN
jgi:hypothetical protein